MQQPMAENLRKQMQERLDSEGIFNTGAETYVTPRRLVLSVQGLSLTQEDSVTERRGPRTDAPKKAIDGFLRSTGLTLEELEKRRSDKGEFYYAVIKQEGRPTRDVVMEAVNDIVPALTWPKSMRWGDGDARWVRPLRNICCVFGAEVMPFEMAGLSSNSQSFGHRFLAPDSFAVKNFKAFKKDLEQRSVILSTEKRKEIILERARELAVEKSLELLEDVGLLDEVAGLVEWPEVLIGSIDEEFMDVPEEVLVSSIRTHQKYFCLRYKKGAGAGRIAPYFIVVSNMKTDDNGAGIIAGNERVLRARLADATFFWNQDRKTPLEERVDDLKRVVFHAKLGSVADKVARIRADAKLLAVWVPHAGLEQVDRAALLCKTDLVTEMVGEFPDLQGLMGYYYAHDAGEPDEVAGAIREHYSPLGPNDTCPNSPVSAAVSIADKIDTLAGLFAIDEKPTGSKDPFALRRAALGIIRVILENKLSVPLKILIDHALKQYPSSLFKQVEESDEGKKRRKKRKVKPADVTAELLEFFSDRLKALLKAENVRHDLISAVFDGGSEDDMLRLVNRVAALTSFLATEDGENLLAAYRRAGNIVRIEEKNDNVPYKGNPAKSLLEQEEERILLDRMNSIKSEIKKALKEDRFEAAMSVLATLRKPVDDFFDNVTVNCDNPDLRRNRLKLLSQMRDSFHDIANFDRIEG